MRISKGSRCWTLTTIPRKKCIETYILHDMSLSDSNTWVHSYPLHHLSTKSYYYYYYQKKVQYKSYNHLNKNKLLHLFQRNKPWTNPELSIIQFVLCIFSTFYALALIRFCSILCYFPKKDL